MQKNAPYNSLKALLQKEGYSEKMIKELCQWYGYSETKRAANFQNKEQNQPEHNSILPICSTKLEKQEIRILSENVRPQQTWLLDCEKV